MVRHILSDVPTGIQSQISIDIPSNMMIPSDVQIDISAGTPSDIST